MLSIHLHLGLPRKCLTLQQDNAMHNLGAYIEMRGPDRLLLAMTVETRAAKKVFVNIQQV
jgi:hypothetical protein